MHQNYVGIDTEKNPYFLSIVSQDSGNKSVPLYRAILFRKQVNDLSMFNFWHKNESHSTSVENITSEVYSDRNMSNKRD